MTTVYTWYQVYIIHELDNIMLMAIRYRGLRAKGLYNIVPNILDPSFDDTKDVQDLHQVLLDN